MILLLLGQLNNIRNNWPKLYLYNSENLGGVLSIAANLNTALMTYLIIHGFRDNLNPSCSIFGINWQILEIAHCNF